jgi:DNA-binding transcriptional LysR family regulator
VSVNQSLAMNPHHLELFYYVAKHEGITEATRRMPYGIQQPAVSSQISQLEAHLGAKLFQRRPFALTPVGIELYQFISPMFSRMDQMTERLRGEESSHLRLTASAVALSHHLPEILDRLRHEYPGLRLSLRESVNANLVQTLLKQEADLAIAIMGEKPLPGIRQIKLLEVPLAIAAPAASPVRKFREICPAGPGSIRQPLISLPRHEPVAQRFQDGLGKLQRTWEPSMEVSELGLILNYVSRGFGFGLAVDIPGSTWPAGVRKIKLPSSFGSISIGVLHCGTLKPVAARLVELAKSHAAELGREA